MASLGTISSRWARARASFGRLTGPTRDLVGACVGILVTALVCGSVMGPPDQLGLLLLAPIGGSAVLVFTMPESRVAQPWPVIAGNTLSALVGLACLALLGTSALAAAVAVSAAIAAMALVRALHPPGGSSALAAVLGGPFLMDHGLHYVAEIAANSVVLVGVAIAFHALTGRCYVLRFPGRRVAAGLPDGD